jgi:predicted XRE-type DNA-binding protein
MTRKTRPIAWIKAARKDFEERIKRLKLGSTMSDDFELVRGSGNVFRDFDMPNPDLEQLRAILAAQIIKALDRKRLTVRKAAELTGIAAADFSRIRNANIGRFTVDRLMTVLGRLDQRVDVNVKVRPNVKRANSLPGVSAKI